jgi:hypothetical protein
MHKNFPIAFYFVLSLALFACSGNSQETLSGGSNSSANVGSTDAESQLLGSWAILLTSDAQDLSINNEFNIFLNKVEIFDASTSDLAGTGCMMNVTQDFILPLSFQAIRNEEVDSFNLVILSTLFDEHGEPAALPIRLVGTFSGEDAEGSFANQNLQGSWTGNRESDNFNDCLRIAEMDSLVTGDLHTVKDATDENPRFDTSIEVNTVLPVGKIVAETPDGQEIVFEAYSDMWTPQVELESNYRFLADFEGEPLVGANNYSITLYDILGEPIPGALIFDGYSGCEYSGPRNVVLSLVGDNDLQLSWDRPELAEAIEGVSYQISFTNISLGEPSFGASDVMDLSHIIPWDTFEPDSIGKPDGTNYGIPLSAFVDGDYEIATSAFFPSQDETASLGSECAVFDNSENLIIEIRDGNILLTE